MIESKIILTMQKKGLKIIAEIKDMLLKNFSLMQMKIYLNHLFHIGLVLVLWLLNLIIFVTTNLGNFTQKLKHLIKSKYEI